MPPNITATASLLIPSRDRFPRYPIGASAAAFAQVRSSLRHERVPRTHARRRYSNEHLAAALGPSPAPFRVAPSGRTARWPPRETRQQPDRRIAGKNRHNCVQGGCELIGGVEPGRITLRPFDPAWRDRFEAERKTIQRALGERVIAVEHIGSTAVPGLSAKPIVDILVVLRTAEDLAACAGSLETAAYSLRVREDGHLMFRTPDRGVHVHIWTSSYDVDRHVLFRDHLRTNRADRQLYERVKVQLARREWADTNDYAAAKSPVIAEILRRATAPPPRT